ncbi:GNAT family N-acetyltransferase [Vannielia litorea]|uniref:GNAT family N-acetyltransferase n=1 Tax=Vannielia litorea TaxID=1217970 RepID=UPI001C94F026|nr:GNAT family N-acetyltransferase [Vannielia litorea]MBY6046092.1 GNAT family N-acetyltransferase [Vannielia litorea]MBY6073505.1 GNAT family N-acetyltransferase [Vannielia litorea]MBY6154047.1 GNAT family N-acetyltransferase [Vannielia litorea]
MPAPHETPIPGAAARLAAQVSAMLPVADTARTRLRPATLTDFDTYAEIACDPVRGRGLGGPVGRNEAFRDFAAMVGCWLLRGHGLWAVMHEGALAGFVQIGFEPGDEEPELGWFFTEAHEGKGLAREAAEAAREIGFCLLGLPSMVSYVDSFNSRSNSLAKRLGADRIPSPNPDLFIWRHRRPE